MTIPIQDALGRLIRCPAETGKGITCGHPVEVRHAKGRVSREGPSQPIRTAARWYLLECGKSGNKLYKKDTPVELAE